MCFRAENPIELLGLVAIRDHHSAETDLPYWWRIEGPNIIAEIEARWRNMINANKSNGDTKES